MASAQNLQTFSAKGIWSRAAALCWYLIKHFYVFYELRLVNWIAMIRLRIKIAEWKFNNWNYIANDDLFILKCYKKNTCWKWNLIEIDWNLCYATNRLDFLFWIMIVEYHFFLSQTQMNQLPSVPYVHLRAHSPTASTFTQFHSLLLTNFCDCIKWRAGVSKTLMQVRKPLFFRLMAFLTLFGHQR